MTRYVATVESAAALGTAAPTGGTANSLFANILGMNASGGLTRVRRMTLGVRAGSSAPTSQQLTVGFTRTTARGTATTTNAWGGMEGYTGVTNALSPGIDVAWSAVPTGVWTAPYFWEVSFNTQATVDLPWELLEELFIQPLAAYNGIALFNVGNAVPTAHLYTVGVEVEV
jgi:hypothetical protein